MKNRATEYVRKKKEKYGHTGWKVKGVSDRGSRLRMRWESVNGKAGSAFALTRTCGRLVFMFRSRDVKCTRYLHDAV